MHLTHALTILLSAIATASPQDPTLAPPASEVQIAGIAFAGSGCPAGSVSGNLLPETSKIALAYTDMIAQTGRNTTVALSRRNCQLNVKVRHPPNWMFSARKTTYRGHARIPVGSNGTARATYYWSGSSKTAISTMTLPGPFDGEFTKVDVFSEDNLSWSPCGSESMININAEVRLLPVNSTEPALLSLTSLEDVELGWMWCGPRVTTSSTSAAPTSTDTV
ncbi:hypothetical protein B0T14DRAFT_483076 [Immersiella caudata]|uniref:DUF4360 domain-containing protein n=1 Tax=Immersiella caudata TaxID=314043 RepID=A0AA39WJV6_9PEZI|nr:hypothetical protein B0T14DRAFT_483076 [Immersiella caudata]